MDQARRRLDHTERTRALDRYQQMGFSLLTSSRMRDALDIGRESLALRQRYGLTLFGVVAGATFFLPGWKYFRQARGRGEELGARS